MKTVEVYDTTLRDGTQGERVSLSKLDKLRITERLDDFGVAYIEGGWPGSNPRDLAFFAEARRLRLKTARLAAFGSTRRHRHRAAADPNLKALLAAETPVCTIFGKAWLLHVHRVLHVTPADNLRMIADSCAYLKRRGREVIYDAEHFFDGYRDNADYAVQTLLAALDGGADAVVLCDTNGGALTADVAAVCRDVLARLPAATRLGVHMHNDAELAVANSLAGVTAGATQVQGTINGIGERCGNANLCSIIPALELKLNRRCLPPGRLRHLVDVSNFVCDLANLRPDTRQPYVGRSAFAHKAGVHVNAVHKVSDSYEHVRPELVGNHRRVLVSDLAGGSNILIKAAEHHLDLERKSPEVKRILAELKKLEHAGYEFEAAGASFGLLMRKTLHGAKPFFQLEGFRVIVEKRGHHDAPVSEATVKVTVDGTTEISAAEGDGPVNALDLALRQALTRFYPSIAKVRLRDYKVRILDGDAGTAAKTQVLIESTDGREFWGTVGVSENIIEASWQALVDSVEHQLFREQNGHRPTAAKPRRQRR